MTQRRSAHFWAWAEQERIRRNVEWPEYIENLRKSKSHPSARDCITIAETLYDVSSDNVLAEASYRLADERVVSLEFQRWQEKRQGKAGKILEAVGGCSAMIIPIAVPMAVVIWFHQSGFLASSGEYGTILGAILSLGKIAVVMAVPFVLSLVVLSTVVGKTADLQRRAFEKERAERYTAVAETARVHAEQVAWREEAGRQEADLKQARAVIADRAAERDAERELEKKLEAAARTAKRRDTSVWAIAVVIAALNVTGKGITSCLLNRGKRRRSEKV